MLVLGRICYATRMTYVRYRTMHLHASPFLERESLAASSYQQLIYQQSIRGCPSCLRYFRHGPAATAGCEQRPPSDAAT